MRLYYFCLAVLFISNKLYSIPNTGAELATPKGKMEGVFHMASVDMQTTDSAHVGNPVEALSWASNDKRRFEAKVGRFGFIAEPEMRR